MRCKLCKHANLVVVYPTISTQEQEVNVIQKPLDFDYNFFFDLTLLTLQSLRTYEMKKVKLPSQSLAFHKEIRLWSEEYVGKYGKFIFNWPSSSFNYQDIVFMIDKYTFLDHKMKSVNLFEWDYLSPKPLKKAIPYEDSKSNTLNIITLIVSNACT